MELDQMGEPAVAYLVHDLDDAAVRRRASLLREEGLSVALGGFHRRAGSRIAVASVVDLGRTIDARLLLRLLAILRHLVLPGAVRTLCADASVIVARNLEMLVLANRVRRHGQRLVYECLDIHRLMLGGAGKSRVMRWVERRLLRRTDLVIVSSPAFARDYFSARQGRADRVLLVENKVPTPAPIPEAAQLTPVPARYASASARSGAASASHVLGWFGMLRCRRTLQQLTKLAAASSGRLEVVIAGIPSTAVFADFAAEVAEAPGLRYLGAYRAEDLARLYGGVDFVWAIDYFEEGLNSDWLLPNRLYEGLAHGAIPVALRGVETGRWLERHRVGLLVDDPAEELPRRLDALTVTEMAKMRAAIGSLPDSVVYQTPSERRAIVAAISGRSHA